MCKKEVYRFSLIVSYACIFFSFSEAFSQHYRNFDVSLNDNNGENRLALIIANNGYPGLNALFSPISSAKKLAPVLKEKGFDVLQGHDLSLTQMIEEINNFAIKAINYDLIMVFYLGHGFEIDGENYLIPIDASFKSKKEIPLKTVNTDYIFRKLKATVEKPKILVFDACRENPPNLPEAIKTRGSWGQGGFADSEAPDNAEVWFTTRKGSVVNDDNPFMQYFIEELHRQNCLDDIFRSVGNRITNYNSKQKPAKYGYLKKDVCFGNNIKPTPNPNPDIWLPKKEFVPKEELEQWVSTYGTSKLEKAAIEGNAIAQRRWGRINQYVFFDDLEAVKWYRKAVNQNDAIAQVDLGHCYATGKGIVEDDKESVKLYKKAANQGNAKAQYNLGIYGEYSLDWKEAAKWYKRAANQGHRNSQYRLANLYSTGVLANRDYTEAVKWYKKAANQGDRHSQYDLGYNYLIGRGVKEDDTEGVKWLRKAANQGLHRAQYRLGVCYSNGEGLEKDEIEAKKWFKKACDQEYNSACEKL